jgi:hypothetical protein
VPIRLRVSSSTKLSLASFSLYTANMSSNKGLGKRLGFKRTNINQDPVTVTELSPIRSNAEPAESSTMIAGSGINQANRDISEKEANRYLTHFRRDHKWDPNMPDDAVEMVDAVTRAHNHEGEAQLVGDIIENSPYPEVSGLWTFESLIADRREGSRRRPKL